MTSVLVEALQGVISIFNALVEFTVETDYPGFTISIAAVLIGLFMISVGFDYLDFFLGSSHVRTDK